ncbi:hypothetical protein GQ53DRAFT_882104 [Thozetella sp. PMI_491]|nr:hypothetical protein GQ53DRAFT_882104 [Thozetella sp. PMI_491]
MSSPRESAPSGTTPSLGNKRARKSHLKSKNGCSGCKKRKCGEERPSCRNCLRRGLHCDFTSLPASPSNTRAEAGSLSIRALAGQVPLTPEAESANSGIADLSILDLELLHHFTTSTCLTVSTDPFVRSFWRINVPQIGFSNQYVLYATLALAALHLARFRPERRELCVAHAMMRHAMASSLALPLLSNITPEKSVPLYFFSIITSYIGFASPKESSNFLFVANDAMPDWLYLFRGVRSVIEVDGDGFYSSPISFLFRSGIQLNEIWDSNFLDHDALKDLEQNMRTAIPPGPKLSVLLTTIDDMRRAFYLFYHSTDADESKERVVFMWLFKIPDEYLGLLKDRDNEALCVLSFFCVLLNRIEHHWWVEGWGVRLIERVYTALDEVHRLWIRWPIEEIGWVPKIASEIMAS